jgi:sugar phosphate isomerase/epimerase
MTIGVKLDIGFDCNGSCRKLFGTRDVLGLLSRLGVGAVETAVDHETDFTALAEHIRICTGAGFRVSLHPYSEGSPCNPAFFTKADRRCRRFHTMVFMAAEDAGIHQRHPAIVNIHAAAAENSGDRGALVDESIRFFKWGREWCAENAPHVTLVTELQFRPSSDETIQRIGDNYEEVLEIATKARVGVCLDLGHAYMNHKRFGLPLDPPQELLPRVAHVHCHDAPEIDHRPLVHDRVPCRRLLAAAIDSGFDGTVVLEVPTEVYLESGGMDALVQSVDKLRAISAASS